MAKQMFSNGFALAVLALSAIRQADAFVVVKPSVSHGTTTTELNVLPTLIKKGEKVETDIDLGILVQAAGYLGAGVVALGIIFVGPQNGDLPLPTLNLPFIGVVNSNGAATPGTTSAASATKTVEKKVVKAKKSKFANSAYDLELDEAVRTAEVKAAVKGASKGDSFDRAAASKKADEASAAAKAKVEAATAEKKAAAGARQAEADDKKLKLAEANAEKGAAQAKSQAERVAAQAKSQEERVAKQAEAKEIAAKERDAAADARKAGQAEKKVKTTEQTTSKQADAAASKAAAGEEKAAKAEAEAKAAAAAKQEAEAKAVKEAEVKADAPAPTPAPAPAAPAAAVPASSGSALGKVSGAEAGGKVLQKEELSADVLNTLKKFN